MAKSEQSFTKLPVGMKVAVGVALVLALCAIYYSVFHANITEEIQNARAEHVQLQSRMEDAEARNAEYVRLRQELSSREGLDRTNLRALPVDAETASFLQDLNRLAELSGLGIQLVEPRPEEPQQHYIRLPVNLHLRGRYHQLARFFYNVSRLDRLISMEDIHLSDPELEGDEVLLSVQVLATTYRRQAEAPAGGAPSQEAAR